MLCASAHLCKNNLGSLPVHFFESFPECIRLSVWMAYKRGVIVMMSRERGVLYALFIFFTVITYT